MICSLAPKKEILAPSVDARDLATGERAIEIAGNRPTQSSVEDVDAVDDVADRARRNSATSGFDFRQFRHAIFMTTG